MLKPKIPAIISRFFPMSFFLLQALEISDFYISELSSQSDFPS